MLIQKIYPVLFLLLGVFHPCVNAQAVFAPVKGAKWTYVAGVSQFSYLPNAGTQTDSFHQAVKATYSKDTLINSRSYKIIEMSVETKGVLITGSKSNATALQYDTANFYTNLKDTLFIRQTNDTVIAFDNTYRKERIYFVYAPTRDSVNLLALGYPTFPTRTVYFDLIDSYSISGKTFKSWYGSSYAVARQGNDIYGARPLTFLDRVGPIDDLLLFSAYQGFISPFVSDFPRGLVCYEDPEIGFVRFKDVDCNLSVKVETQNIASALDVGIYFSPSSQRIIVESKEVNLTGWNMSLINISGQTLLTASLSGFSNQIIPPAVLPGGIYFVHLANKTTGAHLARKIFIDF